MKDDIETIDDLSREDTARLVMDMFHRITTECIACPPDDHPDEWYCAWRFKLTAAGA